MVDDFSYLIFIACVPGGLSQALQVFIYCVSLTCDVNGTLFVEISLVDFVLGFVLFTCRIKEVQ